MILLRPELLEDPHVVDDTEYYFMETLARLDPFFERLEALEDRDAEEPVPERECGWRTEFRWTMNGTLHGGCLSYWMPISDECRPDLRPVPRFTPLSCIGVRSSDTYEIFPDNLGCLQPEVCTEAGCRQRRAVISRVEDLFRCAS